MRKLLLALAIVFGVSVAASADESAFFKAGPLELSIPLKTTRIVYLFDFNGNRSLVGGETPIIRLWDKVEGTVGAVTSLDGIGAPFVGGNVLIGNVLQKYVTLPEEFNLGAFGGRDFRADQYIYGLKASLKVW